MLLELSERGFIKPHLTVTINANAEVCSQSLHAAPETAKDTARSP